MLSTEFPGGRDITACLPDDTRVLERDFIPRVAPLLHKNNDIDKSFYDKYDVKMGLRNKNGTGVRVGLTHIADVRGYDIDENRKKIAVPGKLFYRGIDVEDLVKGKKDSHFGYEEVLFSKYHIADICGCQIRLANKPSLSVD